MGDADGGIGLVDVLAAGAGGAEGVHLEVGGIDVIALHLVHLGHDRHGAGGGVDTPLGLGLRDALHAVGAGLELEP